MWGPVSPSPFIHTHSFIPSGDMSGALNPPVREDGCASCRALGWLETWGDTRGLQLCVMGCGGSGRLTLEQRRGDRPFQKRSGLCEGQVRSSLAHRGRKQIVRPLCQELGTQEWQSGAGEAGGWDPVSDPGECRPGGDRVTSACTAVRPPLGSCQVS